jgi:hypothetical protein
VRGLVNGIESVEFMIIPGWKVKITYWMHRGRPAEKFQAALARSKREGSKWLGRCSRSTRRPEGRCAGEATSELLGSGVSRLCFIEIQHRWFAAECDCR